MNVSHRLLLALATLLGYTASTRDAKAAFLNAELPPDELVCIFPPEGEAEDPNVVYLCVRALYGFRKSLAYF